MLAFQPHAQELIHFVTWRGKARMVGSAINSLMSCGGYAKATVSLVFFSSVETMDAAKQAYTISGSSNRRGKCAKSGGEAPLLMRDAAVKGHALRCPRGRLLAIPLRWAAVCLMYVRPCHALKRPNKRSQQNWGEDGDTIANLVTCASDDHTGSPADHDANQYYATPDSMGPFPLSSPQGSSRFKPKSATTRVGTDCNAKKTYDYARTSASNTISTSRVWWRVPPDEPAKAKR